MPDTPSHPNSPEARDAASVIHPVIDLAEKLLEIARVPMSKIWFANSGSEGNDSAARIAWY